MEKSLVVYFVDELICSGIWYNKFCHVIVKLFVINCRPIIEDQRVKPAKPLSSVMSIVRKPSKRRRRRFLFREPNVTAVAISANVFIFISLKGLGPQAPDGINYSSNNICIAGHPIWADNSTSAYFMSINSSSKLQDFFRPIHQTESSPQ